MVLIMIFFFLFGFVLFFSLLVLIVFIYGLYPVYLDGHIGSVEVIYVQYYE